jgi:hypothetical protein
VSSSQWPVKQTASVPLTTAFFTKIVASTAAPVVADDYHATIPEDNSRLNLEVEGDPGALSVDWQMTTDYWQLIQGGNPCTRKYWGFLAAP